MAVFVLGGVNMDISGAPFDTLRTGDSNPGRVSLSPGGVGRNIAENLARLGRKVFLVSALGDDAYANLIREHSGNAGIDLRYSVTVPNGRTCTYLCLNEQNGDLHAAVADMALCEQLTPDVLSSVLSEINRSELTIVDANLPENTIRWIAENVTSPLAADPVSAAKAHKLAPLLPRLSFLKPNIREAAILARHTFLSSHGEASALTEDLPFHEKHYTLLASALLSGGVQAVFLSLGAEGVWADDGRSGELLPCLPGPVVNTTGCGDAFMAAAADGWLRGFSVPACARRGLAAAALCASGPEPVSPRLSPEILDLMSSRL